MNQKQINPQKSSSFDLESATYEQKSFFQRLKEVIALPLFVLISALLSVIIMNIIAVPILYFVKQQPELFTNIVAWAIVIIIAASIVYRISKRLIFYIRSQVRFLSIVRLVVFNKLQTAVISLIGLAVVALLFFLLYLIFTKNSSFTNTFFS